MSKQERHQMIRNLVETRNIETQDAGYGVP